MTYPELAKCESPIEHMLGEALFFVFDASFPRDEVEIVPQFRIGRYRYDFAIKFCDDLRKGGPPVFVIECDGKQFHGDAQLENDIAKNRAALEIGSHCLRYRGRDIYRNPYLIAHELAQAVEHMRQWFLQKD
jgi:very-short-patch-repair endonuclease